MPLEADLHRTWVQLLLDHDYRDLAAMVLDGDITVVNVMDNTEGFPDHLTVGLPTASYGMIANNESAKTVLERALLAVVRDNIWDNYGNAYNDLPIQYRVKLIEIEEGWQEIIRKAIIDLDSPNQGLITEKVFSRERKQPYTYFDNGTLRWCVCCRYRILSFQSALA